MLGRRLCKKHVLGSNFGGLGAFFASPGGPLAQKGEVGKSRKSLKVDLDTTCRFVEFVLSLRFWQHLASWAAPGAPCTPKKHVFSKVFFACGP